ncbi:MAG: hypothetical protein WAM71_11685, partial [Candidatus Korobacteraceae bacterium]
SPRMVFENAGGMNTVEAPDLLKPGQYAYLQNCRKLLGGRITARPPVGDNLLASPLPDGVTSVTRMKDPYMGAPGYVFIEGANGKMYVGASQVAHGLSGNPLSFLPYRPPASPQPWCYVADPSLTVSIDNPSYAGYTGPICGMLKVRSDGTCYKTGVEEPQAAAVVTSPGGGSNSIVYRYTYRSTVTGATSNPSPESLPVVNGGSNQDVHAGPDTTSQWRINLAQWGLVSHIWRTQVGGHFLLDPIYTQNMGLSVPDGITITGIVVNLQWGNEPGSNPGTLQNMQLTYQGQLIGTQKLPGIQSVDQVSTPPSNDIGSYGDTWGVSDLSPTLVNDPTFGVEFQIYFNNGRIFVDGVDITVFWTLQNSDCTPTPSTDPQVDVIDWYRMGGPLENFTYVGTSPNTAIVFNDTLDDDAATLNPILSFANYEPFPSIDLPRKGVVNVGANGALTWVSGDTFNLRWLPGTIVVVGGVAFVLYNRPPTTMAMNVYTSTVSGDTIIFGYPATGTNINYQIAEPDLAAEPSPVIWGPTPDNAGAFAFGLDPLNPGYLVWTLGNNFDSAPDTNRMEVTSPSEPLMNGTITSELSTVFSTERFWLIYPNFSDAVAAVTGTLGQQWTLVQSAATRGLYMRYAIAALASLIAWRAKDGIFLSVGGGPEQEISKSIYNLFPHGEPTAPSPVVIGGNTVYPPDDTKPNAQTMAFIPGYIFYDYQDTNGDPRTLVYDIEAKGWNVDVTDPVANCHALAVADNQILLGCVDGTVRAFDATATEAGSVIVSTGSANGGSPRTTKRIGGAFVRALAAAAITPEFWANRYGRQITGTSPATLGTNAAEADYLVDFTAATGADVLDLA